MTEDPRRASADTLLERVQREEQQARRGKLKVFFGASPGVGKTYAMLTAARLLRAQGLDVVVGVVETHGRSETAQLLTNLELLPTREITHRGHLLREFDLDGALQRDPALLLVDELAHTNAPGTRHPKRWQDVEELLASGIDVYTTINVQHLESLNDIVGSITGIRVRETVPDRLLETADEVVLVDLPPDDLLQRLKEGKVYLPDQAKSAIQNFFRKGNLLALRELALRRTAERVDDEMRSYRRDYVGGKVWQAQEAVLVCVGPGPGTDKIVRAASRLAAGLGVRWHAIYVETPALQRLPEARRKAILDVLKLAHELGAQTTILAAPNAAQAAVDYARAHNLNKVVIGRNHSPRGWWFESSSGFANRISRFASDLDVVLVASDAVPTTTLEDLRSAMAAPPLPWPRYAGALAVSVGVTVLATPLYHYFDLANIVMLFLLGVVLVAMRWGRRPAVLAAIVNVIAFDFFFVPPRFSFAVSDIQYLFTFSVMLIVGVVTGHLTASLRYQARVAGYRAQRADHLFEIARELSAALTTQQITEIGMRLVAASFHARTSILLLDRNDQLGAASPSTMVHSGIDLGIAHWCLNRNEPAGIGTDTLPAALQLYIPLKAPMRTRGVLVVEPSNPRLLMIPEQRRLLETFAALMAIAVERVHFVAVAQETLVGMEAERLRNSLLSALSHDLRTPLTALIGLADPLSMQLAVLKPDYVAQVDAIREQARRTAQLVNNLLEMARLQAGDL